MADLTREEIELMATYEWPQKSPVGAICRQLLAAMGMIEGQRDAYERLNSASNVQLKTIDDLRNALLHLAYRTHPPSNDCDACRNVEWELKSALAAGKAKA